jgi:hypothetical protein
MMLSSTWVVVVRWPVLKSVLAWISLNYLAHLDLDGVLNVEMAKILANGTGRVHGIDSSPAMIEAAKVAAKAAGVEQKATFEGTDRVPLLPRSTYKPNSTICLTLTVSKSSTPSLCPTKATSKPAHSPKPSPTPRCTGSSAPLPTKPARPPPSSPACTVPWHPAGSSSSRWAGWETSQKSKPPCSRPSPDAYREA